MRMILTAGALSAALLMALIGAVHAKQPLSHGKLTVTPIVVVGE